MKTLKKRSTILVVALLVLSIVLIGCASTTPAPSPTEEPELTTTTGEAEGYGGTITAEVTVDENGVIKDLKLTGDGETEDIGRKALPELQEAIIQAGTIEGVDGVSGATWTSNGVFDAIKNALGIETTAQTGTDEDADSDSAVSASGLKHGIGLASTPRLGPGADDQEVPVYSFNEVVAYVITDSEDRIVDLEVDILEIITPNHDSPEDNYMAGWPGLSYNDDSDGDGTVDGTLEETEEAWAERLKGWRTKRALGSAYKLNSGTWAQEMDTYEAFLKGKTADEVKEAFATLFSDVNGRPLNGNSENEDDIAKRDALSDEQLAEIDLLAGATMSISDAHGDIIAAICNAIENAEPIQSDKEVDKIGLSVLVTPRLGPGSDDKEIPVYSFNVVMAGSALDSESRVVGTRLDILEIITPNHDSPDDNMFTGWPGQSYNADADGDGVTEGDLEQTEDLFTESIPAYRSKRTLGSAYKMNSGTWEDEIKIYESWLQGKTSAEINESFTSLFSDVNGRPLNGNSENEDDIAKRDALSDDQLAEIDLLAGATMSFSDAHGDMLAAVINSIESAK